MRIGGISPKTFGNAPCARDQLGLQGPKEHETPDLSVSDEVLLRKRMLIESVIRELKTQTQLEHHGIEVLKTFKSMVSALIAYQLCEKKPSLNIHELQDINDLPMLYNP